MAEIISNEQATEQLGEGSEWAVAGGRLKRELKFRDFSEAFAFVIRVALIAERSGHHPDIQISYSSVRLELTTHDAGGLTGKDLELARLIDALARG